MKSARWNFDATDYDVLVCRDDHDKGEKCRYVKMEPHEIVSLLNDYRSRILHLEAICEAVGNGVRR